MITMEELFYYFKKMYPNESVIPPHLIDVYKFIETGKHALSLKNDNAHKWASSGYKPRDKRVREQITHRIQTPVKDDKMLRLQSIFDVIRMDVNFNNRLADLDQNENTRLLEQLQKANKILVNTHYNIENRKKALNLSETAINNILEKERQNTVQQIKACTTKEKKSADNAINTGTELLNIYKTCPETNEREKILAYEHGRLAKIYAKTKNNEKALEHYNTGISSLETLEGKINDIERKYILAHMYGMVSNIHKKTENIIPAKDYKEKEILFLESLEGDIDETYRKCELVAAYSTMANLSPKGGEDDKKYLLEVKKLGDTLITNKPYIDYLENTATYGHMYYRVFKNYAFAIDKLKDLIPEDTSYAAAHTLISKYKKTLKSKLDERKNLKI